MATFLKSVALGSWLLFAALAPVVAGAQAAPAPAGGAGLARRRPPPPREITTAASCRARIVDRHKQQRCVSCIERGGTFHEQSKGAGFCVERDQQLLQIRQLQGCRVNLGPGDERGSCLSCLKQGGIYRYLSKGQAVCYPQLTGPLLQRPRRPGEVRKLQGCTAKIRRPDKQQRCEACLKKGGIFLQEGTGPGTCELRQRDPAGSSSAEAASLRNALRGGLGSDQACREQVPQAPLCRRCQRCVEQGGWFYPARGACGPPQGVTPVLTVAECALRLSAPDPLARCRECVRQGGKFYPGGYCQLKPPALQPEELNRAL